MKRSLTVAVLAALLIAAFGCGPKVMVPPRIDLTQHEVVGIVEFDCSAKGQLAPLATREFVEFMRKDQGVVLIMDLGSTADALRATGRDQLDQAAFKALGKEFGVKTVVFGELIVSNVKPKITVTPGLGYVGLAAKVDATLSVQLVETETGASIWSRSVDASEDVAGVSVFGGKTFGFDADDPDKAYGELVDSLVEDATEDFRVTYVRK